MEAFTLYGNGGFTSTVVPDHRASPKITSAKDASKEPDLNKISTELQSVLT